MHPTLAAGVGGFVFLVLLGYGLTRKATYKAESLVYEEPAAAKLLSDGTTGSFDPSRYDSYLEQQKQVIIRPDVLAAAIATVPAPMWHGLGPTEAAATASLAAQLKTDRVKTSYQLSISLESRDPAAAAAIVNAVTKAYLDEVHKESSAQSDQRAQLLAEERSRIEAEMQTARQEQAGLSAKLGVASPVGETANPYDFEIAGVRQQLLAAREAHDVAASQLNSISGAGAGDAALTAAADESILGDPALASMRATVASRRAALNEQMAGMKPENPVYKQDLDEINDLDKTLDTMTRQLRSKAERHLQDKLRTDLERTGDVEARMNAQLAKLTATATTAAPKLQRAAELNEDLTRLNTRYAAVDDALRSLQLEANGPGVVRLSLAAAIPSTPEPSRKMLFLAAAPLAGLICGILAAVFARKRDHRVYSARDVEDILGFAPMTVLPAKNDVSTRVMDEYVLRLAAGLESAYRGRGAQTFLLTAASPSTDIRPLRKALTTKLERIGVDVFVASTTDLLLGDPVSSDEHQIARATEGAGFVANHLANLKGAHALIIINAPPLGTSAETEYVARCADATILIAESGVTTQEELFESARLLQRLEAKGVGAVLQELELRFAGDTFRQAVDAVEQRQPDTYNSTVRARPVVAEAAPVEAEENEYIAPRQGPPVTLEPQVEAATNPFRWTPSTVEESAAARTVESRPSVVEAVPEPAKDPGSPVELEELTETPAAPSGLRLMEPAHEKIAAKLSGPRETSSDGEQPMSGSKNWFQRLLHRDDEKVSIIPDGDDHDQPVDEGSFLTSRISRNVPAYEVPAVREEPELESAAAESASKRVVLEAEQPAQEQQEEAGSLHANVPHTEPESEPVPVVAVSERDLVDVTQLFVAPLPPAQMLPAVAAPDVIAEPLQVVAAAAPKSAIEDLSSTRLLSRLRPARPMSFHELEALAQRGGIEASPTEIVVPRVVAPDYAPAVELASEPVVVADEEVPVDAHEEQVPVVQAFEAPIHANAPDQDVAHFESIHLEPVHEEPSHAEIVAEKITTEAAIEQHAPMMLVADEPISHAAANAETTADEPVVTAVEVVTSTEPQALHPAQHPGSITREIAKIASGVHNAAGGRWDPIPPLRPTDSGWNRMHVNGGNGKGKDSNGSGYSGSERRRGDESFQPSRNQPSHNTDPAPVEFGAQRWAEQAAAAELDEPALSRPWGLLSRFQQTNMITPALRNGAKAASSNGIGTQDHDRELEPGTVRPDGKG